MKYLSEYRDPQQVREILAKLAQIVTKPWTLMEVCGGQTHSLVKNGLLEMLPREIRMVHGPGCPVCVTPASILDEAVELAMRPDVILCSFGDMLRVPGSEKSLLQAKAAGGDVRILYSPLEAVRLAAENPSKEVVFLAVGFETTAPANALSVIQASRLRLNNYSILASHVLVPPAMRAILSDPDCVVDGFLAAGHVCSIMGTEEYNPIAEKYHVPIVVTGFEPLDLVQGIFMAVSQLEKGEHRVENQYARGVQRKGNSIALESMREVFSISDRSWRGLGLIPGSGYEVKSSYAAYNARIKFGLSAIVADDNGGCISGQIMKGLKKPRQCPFFGTSCRPEHPMGAPMVSSEGACAAYFQYAADTVITD